MTCEQIEKKCRDLLGTNLVDRNKTVNYLLMMEELKKESNLVKKQDRLNGILSMIKSDIEIF